MSLKKAIKLIAIFIIGVIALYYLDEVIFFFVEDFEKTRWGLLRAIFFAVAMYVIAMFSIALALLYTMEEDTQYDFHEI